MCVQDQAHQLQLKQVEHRHERALCREQQARQQAENRLNQLTSEVTSLRRRAAEYKNKARAAKARGSNYKRAVKRAVVSAE